ncbi:MAG: hypothetical protein H6Q30_2894 [Bacteroidetes bacterium]|jgi:hypothetical protein|nr:hypothetical protein [Bacteroidota bacterium]
MSAPLRGIKKNRASGHHPDALLNTVLSKGLEHPSQEPA